MKLRQRFLTENDCYRAGRGLEPKGVMVHSTGADNPRISRYVQPDDVALGTNPNANHWNRPGVKKCVHAFIGLVEDGSVAAYQTLPWDMRGWHAGGRANDTHIGFEICEDDLTDPGYFARVYREAVELTAYLCKQYGLDPLADGVVICHKEGARRGVASNHTDVEHWFPRFGKSMDSFRRDVAEEMEQSRQEDEDMIVYKTIGDVPEWYRPTVEKLMDAGALRGKDREGTLDVSEDFCRTMTVLDRMGVLG